MSGREIQRLSLRVGCTYIIADAFGREHGPLRVTERDFNDLDPCRCWLVDSKGVKYDYCPRMCMLNLVDLGWGYKVYEVPTTF
jgi:hypothetical protein